MQTQELPPTHSRTRPNRRSLGWERLRRDPFPNQVIGPFQIIVIITIIGTPFSLAEMRQRPKTNEARFRM